CLPSRPPDGYQIVLAARKSSLLARWAPRCLSTHTSIPLLRRTGSGFLWAALLCPEPCIRRQTPSGHPSIRKCFRYGCVPPAWPLAHRSVSPSPAALYRLLLLYYPVSNKPVGCCQPYLPQ